MDIMQCTVYLLLFIRYAYYYYFIVKIEWNSRGYILFEKHGIPTENAILTTCQSNTKEMYVNLDAEKKIVYGKKFS